MARKIPGKPPHKGARTRAKAFVECSGKEKGKKNLNKMVEVDTAFVLEKRGTDEKALRKASDVNMLVELCSEKKAASGGGTEKFVTIIPRFKLRRGGKVYRIEFLRKRLMKILLTMNEDYE
ncbi:hypothetical protein PAHAL_9G562600 [Panicum hallii]|uniref:Uncharacterized protein n=1 Tax=Panicum hallii TaxID=206008 RepID=A0A2T8I5Y9_9POAL|nr:uncharacterized protein LOC112877174 [Panicum hallii]PVH33080.1 hypothetical protein PAHAL_9G562600 [Panicum hallii]